MDLTEEYQDMYETRNGTTKRVRYFDNYEDGDNSNPEDIRTNLYSPNVYTDWFDKTFIKDEDMFIFDFQVFNSFIFHIACEDNYNLSNEIYTSKCSYSEKFKKDIIKVMNSKDISYAYINDGYSFVFKGITWKTRITETTQNCDLN